MLSKMLWLYCLPYRAGTSMINDRHHPYSNGAKIWGVWLIVTYLGAQAWLVYTAFHYWFPR